MAETAKTFFESSDLSPPAKTSTLTLAQVSRVMNFELPLSVMRGPSWVDMKVAVSSLSLQIDSFLDRMTLLTKEDDQRAELSKIVKRSCDEDGHSYHMHVTCMSHAGAPPTTSK